ncbi:MAG: fructose-1,6-bisphosphatase [Aristaeellaceae bacterium]
MPVSYSPERVKYLNLLSEQFPTRQALYTEIINVSSVLSLPKGTEHFMSDLHGEYEAFCHIMNNCSGVVREKVNLWLGQQLNQREVSELCTLIYYPREKLKLLRAEGALTHEWYLSRLTQLVYLARMLSSKYTREKVRRAMPQEYASILDELLHAQSDEDDNQHHYHQTIMDTLIDIGSADGFLQALATLIKHLAVDRLHVVGDIFDRGPRADSIMDILMNHHSIDIEWGNHDILWMGAASGSLPCVAAVVRNSLSYNNTEILENGYGIPLRPLALFAEKLYPGMKPEKAALEAVTIMMFKLEGQLIRRNPSFGMDGRLLLDKLKPEEGTVVIDGKPWPYIRRDLPTVDPADPYALTAEEEQVMQGLADAFRQSPRLRAHIDFLYAAGRLYRCYNGNLLFHGCVPMTEEGGFQVRELEGQQLCGKALMDYADRTARRAYYQGDQAALDFMWYLWCGDDSPLCGRHIQTFARFFVADEDAWKEPRNPYYRHYNDEQVCTRILAEFGLTDPESRIINGHTPIRVTHGESPLKAGGKLIVIDGGFCRAYQKTTGIAGYTLIANSHGMRLMSHQPFTDLQDALSSGRDIHSQSFQFAAYPRRLRIRDTDQGKRLQERVEDLKDLLAACRAGVVNLKK